jgi:hypothetical protein
MEWVFPKSWTIYNHRLFLLQVYLGEQYVNNATLSDVTFLVEGDDPFCPHYFIHKTVAWLPSPEYSIVASVDMYN